MSKIDPVDYIETIMELYNQDKVDEAKEYMAEHGDTEIKLADLEQAISYILANISAVIIARDTYSESIYKTIFDLLHRKGIVTDKELKEINKATDDLKDELKETIIND